METDDLVGRQRIGITALWVVAMALFRRDGSTPEEEAKIAAKCKFKECESSAQKSELNPLAHSIDSVYWIEYGELYCARDYRLVLV